MQNRTSKDVIGVALYIFSVAVGSPVCVVSMLEKSYFVVVLSQSSLHVGLWRQQIIKIKRPKGHRTRTVLKDCWLFFN